MKPAILVELLERAKAEPIGLAISTTNPHALEAQLGTIRREINLQGEIMICRPSLEGHVFLVHRSLELDP